MAQRERVLVVCSASDTFIGRVIRKLTSSNVNHSFLLYESSLWGGWWAAQIGNLGVQKLPSEKVKPKYTYFKCYEYDASLENALKGCRYMVGQRYDFLGIFGFLVKLLVWRLTGKRIKNPWHKQNHEFCSEFVASVLKRGDVDWFRDCDPASVAPGDILIQLQSNEQFKEVDWPKQ